MITDKQIKLIIGSLLHDIGKVVYRSGDGRNHSYSGYEYLKDDVSLTDAQILNCVRYHHASFLKNAPITKDDSAYITYYADNVAAFSDRRENEEQENGFDKQIPLDSVFNILNGNHGHAHYSMQVLNPENGINYPTEEPVIMDEQFYKTVIRNITDNLKGMEYDEEYLNSLLSVMEANLSYIPSSTSKKELADISLYDHVKITAAIASCVEQYLEEEKEQDYKKRLFEQAKQSYDEKMFLLYSMDISGIQNFIYTIGEKGALKGLRARSFYLEIMMEHIVDELLTKLSLSRSNLIYTGGGHCYLLVPNTTHTKKILEENESELNRWLLDTFDTALYIAGGYAEASANALRNVPEGSYSELYLKISERISAKKAHRYSADIIRKLNSSSHRGERECKVCRRVSELKEDKCPICYNLEKMSGNILYDDFFTVLCEKEQDGVPLPFGRYLVADTEQSLRSHMEKDSYVRCYTKNKIYTGKHVTTKLWVGNYTTGDTFEKLAEQSSGVKRLGVLRADVDNLGTAFVYGFQRNGGDKTYTTISRTAALSRQLSLFFKCYINDVLKNGNKSIISQTKERNVVIVYSGGDDIFLAGAWNDVIASFIDLKEAFCRFSQGMLTISGGTGVYQPKYPLNAIAKEVLQLEDYSKALEGKNAITLFEVPFIERKNTDGSKAGEEENLVGEHRYHWTEFVEKVIGEKLLTIDTYFQQSEEHGMAFLYHLTELLRNTSEKINIARYVYLLSRMEPENAEKRNAYREFSKKMYEWSKNNKDRKELITAIYLYVYLNRKEGEDGKL